MTIPSHSELEELLNSIAVEMARVRSELKIVQERVDPLRAEQNDLKNKQQEILDKHNEEIKYASEQERKIYEVYLEAQRHWNKYKELCREQKAAAEVGIQERSREIKVQLWDDEHSIKSFNKELESLERKWDLAQRKIKDAANYSSMQERLDKLTMGAPWREWAKDHQIDGGRKIAYRGRLLLGDTMGLGKTLTSIIAMDMIRAMTSEADADHPVVLETN